MASILHKIRKYLPQIAFCAAVLWLFYEIYPIIFATHDDMRNYTLVRRGMVFMDAIRAAKTGRISHLWNHHLLALPFLANKVWFYKLIQYAALLFDIYAGWKLLRAHTDRHFADLTAVLAVSWACISAYHNLLISYAFCHQIPIGLCFLSLYHFGNRLKYKRKKDEALSCLYLLLAIMIYEAFTAMLLLYLVWGLCLPTRRQRSLYQCLRRAVKRMLPQIVTVVGYCVVYLIWQMIYPTAYDGISLSLREPFMSLRALMTYSLSFFPIWELLRLAKDHPITILSFCSHMLHPAAWVTAALTTAAFYTRLPHIRMKPEKMRNLLILSGIGVFMPCLLTSMSEKYMDWARRGTDGYLPSFYSYLFLVGFLLTAAVGLWQTAPIGNRKKVLRVLLSVGVFGCCITASAVTDMWKPTFEMRSLRYRNFDYAVSKSLANCDSGWQFYAPDNQGIHLDRAYTQDYLKIYNPEDIAYINDSAALDGSKQTICMRMPENYAYAVIGEVDSALHAKTLTFRTLVPDSFNITLYGANGETLYYTNIRNGNQLTLPEGRFFDLSMRVENTPAEVG